LVSQQILLFAKDMPEVVQIYEFILFYCFVKPGAAFLLALMLVKIIITLFSLLNFLKNIK